MFTSACFWWLLCHNGLIVICLFFLKFGVCVPFVTYLAQGVTVEVQIP